MSRFSILNANNAPEASKPLLGAVKAKLGIVPNMTGVMAAAPAVLEAYLGFSGALGKGTLNRETAEQIAVFVAQQNGCDYCLSAHTTIGKMVGLTPAQLQDARHGEGSKLKITFALEFTGKLLANRGRVSEDDLAALKVAGWSDAEVLEIIGHVALNVFTNYFNVATDVDIDFPKVFAAAA